MTVQADVLRPVTDHPCDHCGHLGVVHRRAGSCTAGAGVCLCRGYRSHAADKAYAEVLEGRLAAVWAYLPELADRVPPEALRPLYALTVLSSKPRRADDVQRAVAIANLGEGEET